MLRMMLIGGKQTFAFEMGFAHIEYENQDNCLNENVFFYETWKN